MHKSTMNNVFFVTKMLPTPTIPLMISSAVSMTKPVFKNKITIWICTYALWIHFLWRPLYSQKKYLKVIFMISNIQWIFKHLILCKDTLNI